MRDFLLLYSHTGKRRKVKIPSDQNPATWNIELTGLAFPLAHDLRRKLQESQIIYSEDLGWSRRSCNQHESIPNSTTIATALQEVLDVTERLLGALPVVPYQGRKLAREVKTFHLSKGTQTAADLCVNHRFPETPMLLLANVISQAPCPRLQTVIGQDTGEGCCKSADLAQPETRGWR